MKVIVLSQASKKKLYEMCGVSPSTVSVALNFKGNSKRSRVIRNIAVNLIGGIYLNDD